TARPRLARPGGQTDAVSGPGSLGGVEFGRPGVSMKRTKPMIDERMRNLTYFCDPQSWPTWPFFPVVRQRPRPGGGGGVLFDALHAEGMTGYSATVSLANIFLLPPTLGEFLRLPRETYDSAEEMYEAGWRVD